MPGCYTARMYFMHYRTRGCYRVDGPAIHTETGETLVIYRDDDGARFARPAAIFHANVTADDGARVPRFTPMTVKSAHWRDAQRKLLKLED